MTLMGHAPDPFRLYPGFRNPRTAQSGEVDAVPDDVDFRVHDRVALE